VYIPVEILFVTKFRALFKNLIEFLDVHLTSFNSFSGEVYRSWHKKIQFFTSFKLKAPAFLARQMRLRQRF
jgi:hypothetical protein